MKNIVFSKNSCKSDLLNWRIILDNAIREIRNTETLCVRCQQLDNLNILNIKRFLGRRLDIDVNILEEIPLWSKSISDNCSNSLDNTITTTTFKIKRKNPEIYKDKSWSFCILTNGNKVDNVTLFCESIRNLDPNSKHEIIICGPKNKLYEKYNIKYLPEFDKFNEDFAEICAKKNALIDFARNENLLICHDRYYLDKNFFDGFEKYGYDFNFISVDTEYENGSKFPHYVKMGYIKHDFKWNKEWFCYKDKNFFDNNEIYPVFVNGGLNIFKRSIVKQIRFNECFFWHQCEDVEISKEFLKFGLIPRTNLYSRVITTKDNSDKIGVNLDLDYAVYGGEIKKKKKKKNLIKRIKNSILKKIYNLITNKKLNNYLERKIFKND